MSGEKVSEWENQGLPRPNRVSSANCPPLGPRTSYSPRHTTESQRSRSVQREPVVATAARHRGGYPHCEGGG
jgi:hypothetical protein